MKKNLYITGNSIWPHTSVPWQQNIISQYLKSINVKKDASVMDLGSGIGNNLESLKGIVDKVTVADISEFALDKLKESYQNKFNTLETIQKDLNMLELRENSYDLVLMTEVIEHLEDPEIVLEKITKILRPGGYLIVSAPNYLNIAGLWKMIVEKLFKKTWDAWGTHEEGIENFTTSLKLKKWLKQRSFINIREQGGDVIRSWFPPLKKHYNFIDRHPALILGRIWPIKYFLMNYFILCKKPNSLQ